MKISKLLLTASVFILPLTANAAGSGAYLALTGEYIAAANAEGDVNASGVGSAPVSADFKNGLGILGAVGYNVTPSVRAELELGYRELKGETESITIGATTYTVDASDTKVKAFTTMGNVYYDFTNSTNLTPYIGAGIGWAHEQEDGANALGYQGMVGVNYKLSENSSVFTGYRYLGTTDFETNYNVLGTVVNEKVSVQAHSIDVGYRYNF